MTKVELAEGKLLNEIHEHKSLGITMALDELVAAAEAQGEAKGHAEGVAEGEERVRKAIRADCTFVSKGSEAAFSNVFDEQMVRATGKFVVVALEDCYVFPASLLAPDKESE
jgi:hypothetical protein